RRTATRNRRRNRRAERALVRYYTASENDDLNVNRFEKRVSALETRLEALREQHAELAAHLAPQAATSPDAPELAAVADNLDTLTPTRRAAAGESPPPPVDQSPPRQRSVRDPPDLPGRHARGLRTAKFSGRDWDRTSDLPRVKRDDVPTRSCLIRLNPVNQAR